MTLASCRSAFLHNKLVMRFGCCLVAVSVLMSCWAMPKAKAVVSEGALLGSIFGSLLVSMGYSWAAENMDMPSFGEAIYKEMKEFDEALKNDSGLSFLADLNLTLLTPLGAGKIGFPVQWVRAANSFAEWFQGKFLSDNTSAVVYSDSGSITLNGVAYPIKAIDLSGWKKLGSSYYIDSASKSLITGGSMKSLFDSGSHSFSYDGKVKTIEFKTSLDPANNNYRLNIYVDNYCPGPIATNRADFSQWDTYFVNLDGYLALLSVSYNSTTADYLINDRGYTGNLTLSKLGVKSSSLTAEKPQEVHYPDVAEDGSQVYEITVDGVTATDIEGIIQGAVDRILAGTAAIVGEVAQAQDVPVEPEVPPELDGLDLPALGAALITRFPFSIPWDVVRGVKLLAAPAETPHFEVDFFAPISDMVGGWKGSTKIVLDFSEFEIIGRVCRWTSTIGFCLMLAAGTKRLIWVA